MRRAVFESGNPKESEGAPLPVEGTVEIPSWGHDEDFIWSVIKSVVGEIEGPQECDVVTYGVD